MQFVLFFFNPVIGFLQSMKDLRSKSAMVVYICFFSLFGYATSFQLDTADSYRIAARFCQEDFSYSLVWDLYQSGGLTDVYLVFVYSVLKLFTSNPKVLFGVLGFVMGIFSYLSIRQLYIVWKGKHTKYFYMLVLFYFLGISVVNLQTVRFFTAASIFSYYAIQYL